MPNRFARGMTDRIARAFREAIQEVCQEVRDDIRESVSVPVEYEGSYVIRSEPEEPPRMEFGDLYKSIIYRTKPRATTAEEGKVLCTREAKIRDSLEFGFVHHRSGKYVEERPFWRPGMRRAGNIQRRVKVKVAQKLKRQSQDPFGALPSSLQED